MSFVNNICGREKGKGADLRFSTSHQKQHSCSCYGLTSGTRNFHDVICFMLYGLCKNLSCGSSVWLFRLVDYIIAIKNKKEERTKLGENSVGCFLRFCFSLWCGWMINDSNRNLTLHTTMQRVRHQLSSKFYTFLQRQMALRVYTNVCECSIHFHLNLMGIIKIEHDLAWADERSER